LSATFSEPIAPASVTGTSFVLRNSGGAAVSASLSVSGSTATLQPSASLAPSTTYTATLLSGSSGIKDTAGNALATDYTWSFTTAAGPTCPCSLWASAATPQTASVDEATSYELGVRFQSDVAGYITGIRFYKGSGNTGTHVGHLWTNTGTQLAAATFTNETASGWQQVSFSSPVPIAANTPYVASYFDPLGHFSLDRPYFTTAHDNVPLHALADGTNAGANGIYGLGTGFPNSTYQSSNYWVDAVFVTSLVDTTPPTVSSVTPASGANGVGLGTSVSATFSEPIAPASVTGTSFVLRDPGGNALAASVSASGSTATLQPSASLASSTTYTATLLSGSSGIKDTAGNALASNFTWSFTTLAVDTTPPTVASVTPADGATNVSLGTSVSATFSEPIAPASVTGTSFVLRDPGGNALAASVSASGSTATLQPSASLASSTTYTATLLSGSSGVKDLAGNALASDFTWSFTTATVDVSPPSSTVAFPTATSAYNSAGWNAGCSPSGICGTASDSQSGVQRVELSIRRLSNGRYWNGTGFTPTAETWVLATGTTSWRYSLAASSLAAGSYTVRVRATDVAGNVQAPSSTTWVYDTTNPSSAVTFPVANASYTTATWNAGCAASGICGTASDAASGVKRVEVSVRRGSGNYWNGTSFSSTSEVFFPATGTTTWTFSFPASSFPAAANYRIRVRATDNAGNVQSPSTRTISFAP
jgi:hypothetical protein